jgi:phospholipid-binding lipoprotein MlaA
LTRGGERFALIEGNRSAYAGGAAREPRLRRQIVPLFLLLASCATATGPKTLTADKAARAAQASRDDPWESFNRKSWAFNRQLDHVVRPLAFLTRGLTPGPVGKGLHNVLTTLGEPVVAANDLFQHRIARGFATLVRLAINASLGLLGTVDVAAKLGIPHHHNSFGDTLGRYGVGPGPYLYLPVLGPYTLRDFVGAGIDLTLTPMFYYKYQDSTEVLIFLNVLGGLDTRAEADADLLTLLSNAADPYATLRSTYLQLRQGEIDEDRAPPRLPDIEDAEPEPGPAAQASAPVGVAGQKGASPGEESASLESLPDQQTGKADGHVPGALEQRQGEGKLGSQAEQRSDESVGPFLDAKAHGGEHDGAASGRDKALDGQDPGKTDADAPDAQGKPDGGGAGDPGHKVHKDSG